MAQGRTRRLVKQLLRWVWVPVVSFVIVVAVAMGCAVWSPSNKLRNSADGDILSVEVAKWVENTYGLRVSEAYEFYGIGVSHGLASLPQLRDETGEVIWWRGVQKICRAGLPLKCMRWAVGPAERSEATSIWVVGIETTFNSSPFVTPNRIPLMPEPVGMVLNVLIYSAAIVLPRLAWRRVVVFRRRRKSLCIMCAYPLGDSAVCPECGNPTARES